MSQERSDKKVQYRGRFAPSPTGPLHIGSLIAAVGSYLQAKSQQGIWLLRIEDIDPPREQEGASDLIVKTLDKFGFEWDGEIIYQSRRSELYTTVIEELHNLESTYFCSCSRKEINNLAKQGLNGPIYPRTCFHSKHKRGTLRFRTTDETIRFDDPIQGMIQQNVLKESGDFVVQRADGLFNYQLAVVVDDQAQAITEVVRGSDLLPLTPSQINLQQTLDYSTPKYIHLPVITNELGQKLSKQTLAPELDPNKTTESLWFCLDFLGQNPPSELRVSLLSEVWQWALSHWDIRKIPKAMAIPLKPLTGH